MRPTPSANTDSASAGWRPSAAKLPSRVTVPSRPAEARVSVSVENLVTSLAQSWPLPRASFSACRACASVAVWMCRAVAVAGVRNSAAWAS